MRVRLVAQAVLFGLLLMIIASAVPASAQGPPTSLRSELGSLYLATSSTLANATPAAASPCGPSATFPSGGNAETTHAYALPFNGSFHLRDPVTFTISFAQPGPAPPAAAPQAATLTGTFGPGGVGMTASAQIPQGPGLPSPVRLDFTPGENVTLGTSGQPLSLKLTLQLQNGNNYQVACGPDSVAQAVIVYRGGPTSGDIDGDGIPDLEDQDRDGDGALNTAEPGTCAFFTPPQAYADNAQVKTGGDSDGDGVNDEVECAAVPASNPNNAASVPARPPSIISLLLPWILLLVVVGLIAAIVFVFLKYGKTAAVLIVSQPELFVPPGTKGKYEVSVENLSKKGEPRTYQLAVVGMPEGWDAKLNVDHVTLEPQGGAQAKQTVWLEVESPAHNEPESAVVSVKATPLNKAGRKDTFKLGGKAETITSINVPPGSKVPVKRGGKVEAADAKDDAPDAAPAAALTLVALGADEASAKKLNSAGVNDSEQLRTADAAALAKKTKLQEATLKTWQQVADLVRLGMTPQQAAALATAGIGSIVQLADADGKEVGTKAGVDEKTGKAWVKAAGKWRKKHKDEMPATPAAAAPPSAAAPASVPAAAAAPAAAPAKPQLQVGGLRHEPPAFRQGDAVKSIVNVSNNGKDKSTIKLSLYVNDGLADVQTVTVKSGKAQDVQFKWTAQEKNKLNIRGEIVPS